MSDDLVRYLWDGRVIAAGFDPYALTPNDPALAPLRDARWEAMPHKDVATVYPPAALAVFALAAALPMPVIALKLLLIAADLGACAALIALARRLGHGPGRAAWYAWNPLVVLEIAGLAHVDALVMLGLALGALGLSQVARPARAAALGGAGLALGALGKLVPLVVAPLWLALAPRRWLFAATAGGILLASLGPIVWTHTGAPSGLREYGVRWEWNGPLYEPTWRLLDRVDADEWLKRLYDARKAAGGDVDFWNGLYPRTYPQLIAKVLLAGVFALAAAVLFVQAIAARRRQPAVDDDPAASAARLIAFSGRWTGWLILCLATIYPWYLLWILPWAALARHRAWLLASLLAPLAYLPQHLDHLALWPWWYLACWLPVAALMPFSDWHPAPPAAAATPRDNASAPAA
ncbi:MAG: hypothetical protein AAF772_09455 [Acidobacteriota bacterium]